MRCLIAICTFAVLLSVAEAQPIEPRERITTELLEVQAPGLAGWQVTERAPARVIFSRRGFGKNGTLAAMAIVFRFGQPRDKEQFLEMVRAGVEADTPSSRFRSLQSELRYEEDRGYPCARYTAVHEDLTTKTLTDKAQAFKMQTHSLYCMHPHAQGAAFVAGYSHRGEVIHSGLDTEARHFIEGVNVRAR